MEYLNISFDLVMALLLGALIGTERSFAGKTAGMRTCGLVSMGSALYVITAKLVSDGYIGIVNFDPSRVAASVVMGVGFIGAGLIIFTGSKVNGLTTAAGLWVSAGG